MKHLIILLSLFLSTSETYTQSEWSKIETNTFYNLNEICFINNDIGFICGDTGTILKTIDAGLHWQTITAPNNDDITSIAFTDELNGAILTYSGINDKKFHVTTDGGITWNQKYAVFCFPEILQAVENKILVGGNGCFYGDAIAIYENDTFTTIDPMLSALNSINHFDFIDNNIGFASSNGEYSFMSSSKIYKTIDGGISWNMIVSTDTILEIFDIAFQDENIGYLVGEDTSSFGSFYPSILYKTIDGGNTWSDLISQLFVTPTFTDIAIYNTDSVVSVGSYINQFNNNGTIWDNFQGINSFDEDFNIDTLNPRLKKNDVLENNGCLYIIGDLGFLSVTCKDSSFTNVKIEKIEKKINFVFFPNPSNEIIYFDFENTMSNFYFELYNIDGKLLRKNFYKKSNSLKITRHSLKNGVYYFKLNIPNEQNLYGKIIFE